jgi:hypothetical protein
MQLNANAISNVFNLQYVKILRSFQIYFVTEFYNKIL